MAKKATKPQRKDPLPEVSPQIDKIVQAELDKNDQYGARPSQAKACPFCKHSYLKPCTDKTKDSCPNYKHLKGTKRGK